MFAAISKILSQDRNIDMTGNNRVASIHERACEDSVTVMQENVYDLLVKYEQG